MGLSEQEIAYAAKLEMAAQLRGWADANKYITRRDFEFELRRWLRDADWARHKDPELKYGDNFAPIPGVWYAGLTTDGMNIEVAYLPRTADDIHPWMHETGRRFGGIRALHEEYNPHYQSAAPEPEYQDPELKLGDTVVDKNNPGSFWFYLPDSASDPCPFWNHETDGWDGRNELPIKIVVLQRRMP